jgi:hypothetical protein
VGISSWPLGDTLPVWKISLVPDSGAFDVTGLSAGNFSMILHNRDTGVETAGAGTFSSVTAAVITNGVVVTPAYVQYTLGAADVATASTNSIYIVITSSGKTQTFRISEWDVVPRT